ncbi:MAG: DUF4965 domain-containing protein [Tannerellaceae bacterium]|nr:DUF4965 domain-containing protein [Tannerellaceae bacterium]
MKNIYSFLSLFLIVFVSCQSPQVSFQPEILTGLRAPAYPLVTIDPYTCAWSFTDQLNEDAVRHWTGKKHPLTGALRVDGVTYRFMGVEEIPLKVILPTAAMERWDARYMESHAPKGDWYALHYSDHEWKEGKAAFGTPDMPSLSTPWESKDIWVRRVFELDNEYAGQPVFLEYSHDDIFELYINGIKVVETDYCWHNNVLLELSDEVKSTLKVGENIIAAHCHNVTGGGYVDFGLFLKEEGKIAFDTPAVQKSVHFTPTQTYYTFTCGPVELNLLFTSPLLPDDLDLVSTPVNYLSYQVRSVDGQPHDVQIYMDATPQWAVDNESQAVTFAKEEKGGLTYLKTGTVEQNILGKRGDDVRIDWGYFYLASGQRANRKMETGEYFALKNVFRSSGTLPASAPNPVAEMMKEMNVLAYVEDLGTVSSTATGYLLIGYDDLYSIQYFGDNRMPYWKHNGSIDIYTAFENANKNYIEILNRCRTFDTQLMQEAEAAGGNKYAELCALAFRQAIAAHKLVEDKEGNLLFFSKENFSNGSIGTVDITYPSAPLFLIYNPELLKGMMNPIFYYSESGKWNKPFAAHDVGTYPQANGQTYGGDMPVEESGNMLILTTAIALVEGNAGYAAAHWDVLTTWADYLVKEGLDPENQLCTDDFAGHFAHNANLSVKAIMGIAGYGKLARMLGKEEIAQTYIQEAKEMAQKWVAMAADGDHYRLTFDQPGTWSQKYNLIWDKFFGLSVFPAEVAETEMAYYLTKQNRYGLPLDNRQTYTKSDWILWSACLTDDPAHFNALTDPVYTYANETTTRMPLSDWHQTITGESVGFRARSVVGGYYMKMLERRLLQNH